MCTCETQGQCGQLQRLGDGVEELTVPEVQRSEVQKMRPDVFEIVKVSPPKTNSFFFLLSRKHGEVR